MCHDKVVWLVVCLDLMALQESISVNIKEEKEKEKRLLVR